MPSSSGRSSSILFTYIGGVIAIALSSSAQRCPPTWIPDPSAFGESDYVASRQKCQDACIADGYCCTLGNGGCGQVPCTTGCHIAFFSSSLQECYDECAVANSNGCYWTHERHPDVAHLGFNPTWQASGGVDAVAKCGGAEGCGCPADSFTANGKNECSADACRRGCELAQFQDPSIDDNSDIPQEERMYRGKDVKIDHRKGKDAGALLDALKKLRDYVNTVISLSWTEINEHKQTIAKNGVLIPTTLDLVNAALDVIDDYDSRYGALFLDSQVGGFQRSSTTEDGKELARAIYQVQQAALEGIYAGTMTELLNRLDRLYDPIVESCTDLLADRPWGSHKYFPGAILGPQGSEATHTVSINTNFALPWGKKVCYSTDRDIKTTGFYLVAGKIGTVTVPQSVVDHGKFRIQVGANDVDTSRKSDLKRLDRITSTYEVKSVTTVIANPFGGGIYLLVPNPCSLGEIVVTIGGGVVSSPIFELTSAHNTTEEEWDASRASLGPWFDLITDNYHNTLPSIWVNGYSFAHMFALASNYSEAMNGVSEFLGYPQSKRNKVVLYESVDLDIRGDAGYSPGHPQVNNLVSANGNGPIQDSSWLVTTAVDAISMHELGHCQITTMYPGETEAIVNVPIGYVKNVKFGEDLDKAFIDSFVAGNFTIDDAMTSWLITLNFRSGEPMDISNTPTDQVRYQRRGYGKYFAIARQFTWDVLSQFHFEENLDQDKGLRDFTTGPLDITETIDERTLRMSQVAGEDLRPLVHVWGLHPKDITASKIEMEAANLFPSQALKEELQRYATLIPPNQAAFIKHFDRVWPGKRDVPLCSDDPSGSCCEDERFGCGWYNKHYPLWDEPVAIETEKALNDIIVTYWGIQPTNPPFPRPSSPPTALPTPLPTSLPLCQDDKPANWCSSRCSGSGPHPSCLNYCSCVAKVIPATTCSCNTGTGPSPTQPPTPPPTPPPVQSTPTTPKPTSPPLPGTSPPTPQPAPTPPSCLAGGELCSATVACCSNSCNKKNGTCRNSRLLRGSQDSDRNLDQIFSSHPVDKPGYPKSPRISFDSEGNPNGINRKALRHDLEYARKMLQRVRGASYSFDYYKVDWEGIQPTRPLTVYVKAGKKSIATYSDTGKPATSSDDFPQSLDDILNSIEQKIGGSLLYFEATYDSNGLPKSHCTTTLLHGDRTKMECHYVNNLRY